MKTKLITTLTLVLGTLMLVLPARVVNASADIKCTEGPYGRICDTGLVLSELGTAIASNSVLALAGVFGLGTVFTLNGKILKAKLQ